MISPVRFSRLLSSLVGLITVASHSRSDLIPCSISSLNLFCPQPNLISRSTPSGASAWCHFIWSGARLAVSVLAHASPFAICFSASPPGRCTDGCASPHRVSLICVPISGHRFIAAHLPTNPGIDPAQSLLAAATAIRVVLLILLTPREGINRTKRARIYRVNADCRHGQVC
jgi:hypothetical protein